MYGVNEYGDLQDEFRELARTSPQRAGPALERRLLATFRMRRNRKRGSWKNAARVGAIAAASCLVWIYVHISERSKAISAPVRPSPEFIALPYAQSGVPIENAVIVRVRIRRSELSAMGMALSSDEGNARVTADLLVAQDGVARAVRVME